MGDDIDIEPILTFIKTAVETHWKNASNPLLLSSLGWSIRQNFENSEKIFENGLKRFLSDHPVAQVVTHPKILQKVGAIPFGVSIPADPSALFGEDNRAKKPPSERKPRVYAQEFWNSFIYEFQDKRFIIIDSASGNWHVSDHDAISGTQKAYEIKRSDILSLPRETPMSVKVPAVHSAIADWLTRNELSRELFENRVSHEISKRVDTVRTTLESAFSRLDSVDLSRISIPLDLVQKMLSGK
ncbi:hypothetical protein FKO01_26935 [Mesorhizobium sp. B2-3-3]|nr:hypothetical protein FKO01_26935 [Mesorhizobium sp. B2-3-3]